MIRSIITGTGSYIPEVIVNNDSFLDTHFFGKDEIRLDGNRAIIDKFAMVTGIEERRYAKSDQNTSDLAYFAAVDAISSSGVDAESIDYIIVSHNFGDVAVGSNRINQVPSVASKVKSLLGIRNPDCVAYDLLFGCPGWVEAIIQANYFICSGDAKRCLVIGAETLSRIIDVHDRDSMIFSDGAGAVILEASKDSKTGVVAHKSQTHAVDYAEALGMGASCYSNGNDKNDLFIKMHGRKVYEFAITYVPDVIKTVLDKASLTLDDVSKVLVHQANEKMNKAILERLSKLYGKREVAYELMPLTVSKFGNSSVATVPTLLDLLVKGQLMGHTVNPGDTIVMASVGAGMNVNALVYQL